MKLKEFNEETCTQLRSTLPSLGINFKTGLFNFNKTACDLLGLKNNDQVIFLQDEDEPQCWYVEKVKSKGFMVREKSNVSTGVLFNNSNLAKQIKENVDADSKSARILIAGKATEAEKRKLWGLLFVTHSTS